MSNKLILRRTILAMLLATASAFPMLGSICLTSAQAQECHDCKIPSGYTTVKQTGETCTNKRVSCTCDQPGGKTVKSTQPMCLYLAKSGGGGGGLNRPVLTPNPK